MSAGLGHGLGMSHSWHDSAAEVEGCTLLPSELAGGGLYFLVLAALSVPALERHQRGGLGNGDAGSMLCVCALCARMRVGQARGFAERSSFG